MLRSIVARWGQDGAHVTVLSAQPSYKSAQSRQPRRQRLDGAVVERLPTFSRRLGRVAEFLNLVAFPAVVGLRLLTLRRPDVVMCSTAPQVTLGFVVSLVARLRGSRVVYHCMDLHPEIGRLSGEFRNPLVYRLLHWMDTRTMRRARVVVVLSEDMRRTVGERDAALVGKTTVLQNFPLPEFDVGVPAPPEIEYRDGVVRVLFAGNLGRFQGLDAFLRDLIAVARESCPVDMVFMGEGKAEPTLRRMAESIDPASGLRVIFVPHGSPAVAKAVMRTADLGLVALAEGVVRYAYPSKTVTYLQEGLPALVVCEPDSALALDIRGRRLGFTMDWGETQELARILEQVASDAAAHAERRRRGRAYVEENLAQDVVLSQWSALLDSAADGGESVDA